ncbi:hypothetical protein LRP30_19735 [Bradyrhizobium sp. C-145]|uniref:hypothetical protein n=1 Tax=Bradyrhizobium sp. C-145 TaxID=574727 RepID=UPI00201B8B85|nr:hypothetical protein [Bradyrhizobium sp. C-145]UQR67354.1 hypothetical protein LRP30_19735 [Bradyrhizobium sp. C-145]
MSIYEHFLTHSDLLKLLPGLKAQTLRNWSRDGFVDVEERFPGVGADRKYSALGVIKLAAMHQLVELGVAVSVAREMTCELGPKVVTAWHLSRVSSHHERVLVWKEEDGTYTLSTRPPVGLERQNLPPAYIVLEIGLLTIEMRERMERLHLEEDAA